MLVHPKELTEATLYAVDQFVMRGGKLFAFVDPFSQSDRVPSDPQNPMAAMTADKSSNLNRLLEKWGVKQIEKKAVADIGLATKVNSGQIGAPKDFVLWLSLRGENLNRDDVSTSALDNLLLTWAAAFEITPVEGSKVETLLFSSERAMLVDEKDYRFGGGEPDNLLRNYVAGNKALVLGARVAGKLNSNFPDGKPATPPPAAPQAGEAPPPPPPPPTANRPHLKESVDQANVVVIGDVDFISDQYSLIAQSMFGRKFVTLLNHNLVFLQNMIENLSGSNDLISIRSRGRFSRPFTVVADIERNASLRWQQEETVLQAKLTAANQRLQQLQSSAQQQSGASTGSQQVFSKAVLDEIKQFREEKNDAQSRLREVRRNLRQDKESLGTRLFLVNTFVVPLALVVIAIYFALIRRRKSA